MNSHRKSVKDYIHKKNVEKLLLGVDDKSRYNTRSSQKESQSQQLE